IHTPSPETDTREAPMQEAIGRLLFGLVVLGVACSSSPANPPTEADQKLITGVSDRLLKKMERAPGFDVWPPDVTARDSKDEPARLKFNAYATWEKPDG